jgi:prephenate dehydrogenase
MVPDREVRVSKQRRGPRYGVPVPIPLDRVAVLGLGLIGGSLMRALRAAGHDCVGYDVNPVTASEAAVDGYDVAQSVIAAVVEADLVVLAMPLPALGSALRELAGSLRADAVLTDVGTLKQPVFEAVRTSAPRARFVGGHPLAGTEESGWAAGSAGLFRDAPWALSLTEDTDLEAWLGLAAVLCELGAHPVPASPQDQDAAVARVIGLPHVLAEALALTGLDGGPLGLSLAAGSYTSGSRVARTRPELVATWCDGNPALVHALDDVLTRLTATRDALVDGGSVLDLARDGYAARMNWEHRVVRPVDVAAEPDALLRHGQAGGWITAVHESAAGVHLRGMLPA